MRGVEEARASRRRADQGRLSVSHLRRGPIFPRQGTTFAWSRRSGRWDIQICDAHSPGRALIATARYAAAATLQRLNLGLRRRKNKDELGFLIEPGTGKWRKPEEDDDDGAGAEDDDPARGAPQRVVPMVEDHKNTLLFRPMRPFSSTATSAVVQHALLRGLEIEFQLEEGELLSEPMPGRDDRRAKTCESDADRLDPMNGLLLAAHWDAAFDRGLVTFADDGTPLLSSSLSTSARTLLLPPASPPLRLAGLRNAHLPYLRYHRDYVWEA